MARQRISLSRNATFAPMTTILGPILMKISLPKSAVLFFFLLAPASVLTAGNDPNNPTWWDKYTYLAKNGPAGDGSTTAALNSGTNVGVSNECGPQNETFTALG